MDYRYDLAVSFAGEDEAYVAQFVAACKTEGLLVFYYRDKRAEWWGRDFLQEQRRAYTREAQYFVPFISDHYLGKPIPRDEFIAALGESVNRFGEYMLPVAVGRPKIPTELLPASVHILFADEHTPEELAVIARARIKGAAPAASGTPAPKLQVRMPRHVGNDFSPYRAAQETLDTIDATLWSRLRGLEGRGYITDRLEQQEIVGFRISAGGRVVLALDMWQGTGFDDSTLAFHHGDGRGHVMGRSSMTATARPVFNARSGGIALDVTNFSLLGYGTPSLTVSVDDFVDLVWDAVVNWLDQNH